MKQNYYVAMKIEARYYVDVEANDVEEAKQIAKRRFEDAPNDEILQMDFVGKEVISVEDEEGNCVYEK